MAIATATSLEVHVGGKLLFEDVSFKLGPRERMTLSGRNGAGKSTLLRVLAGELSPESGSLTIHRGARVALPDQRPPRDPRETPGGDGSSGRSARARGRRRLPLARPGPGSPARARLRRRAGRAPALDLLRR